MSKADRYSKMATRTANQAREAAANAKDRQKYQRAIQGMNIESHRHCVICWTPIPIKSEPAVCDNNDVFIPWNRYSSIYDSTIRSVRLNRNNLRM